MKYIDYKIKKKKATYDHRLHSIIRKFICDRGLLLYGGEAINLLLYTSTGGKVTIYDEKYDTHDYDVMSMDAVGDIEKLKKILIDSGYRYTYIRRAIHKTTHKLFTNLSSDSIIDITMISSEQFAKMRPIKIARSYFNDDVYVIDPHYIKVDQYKNISSHLYADNHRFDKAMKRIKLLEKYFPIEGEFLGTVADREDTVSDQGEEKNGVIGGDAAFDFYYPGRIKNPETIQYSFDDNELGTFFWRKGGYHTRAFLTFYYYFEKFKHQTDEHDWKLYLLTNDPKTYDIDVEGLNLHIDVS